MCEGLQERFHSVTMHLLICEDGLWAMSVAWSMWSKPGKLLNIWLGSQLTIIHPKCRKNRRLPRVSQQGYGARILTAGGKSIYNGTLEEPAWSRLVRESARFPDRSEKESQVLLPFWGIQSAHFSVRAELNLAKKKKKTWENHNLFFSPSGFKLPSQLIVRHQIEARQQVIRLTEANRGESEYGKTSFYSHDSSSRWFIKCILLVYLPSLLVAEGVQGQRGFFFSWNLLLKSAADLIWLRLVLSVVLK